MSSPPSASLTNEGLPISCRDSATITSTDPHNDIDLSRRIGMAIANCQPPRLVSAPSSVNTTTFKPSLLRAGKTLKLGPCHSSLINEDDDDEMFDYFGTGSSSISSGSSTAHGRRSSSSQSQWNIHDCDVPALPSFYPLEKSTVLVPNSSASSLADRVVSVIQARSITASYDAKKAKVDCISESKVEFCIRMYRNMGVLIVEVQRKEGFDVSYMQDVFAILDAAEGKSTQ